MKTFKILQRCVNPYCPYENHELTQEPTTNKCRIVCPRCSMGTNWCDSAGQAISNWNCRVRPTRRLNTFDELLELNGEMVYVAHLNNVRMTPSYWEIVEVDKDCKCRVVGLLTHAKDILGVRELYNVEWVAYALDAGRGK